MRPMRIVFLPGLFMLLALLLAACGTPNNGTAGNNGNSTTPTTTSTTPTSGTTPNGHGTATPKPTTSTSTSTTIKTATATVSGKATTILTDSKGFTLYYFKPDTSTTSNCTGGCAGTWPPLLVTGSSKPTSTGTLPGKLTALADGNGTQVQYNGHFLYTYSGDTAAGQTNGEGLAGKWFVAAPTLKIG